MFTTLLTLRKGQTCRLQLFSNVFLTRTRRGSFRRTAARRIWLCQSRSRLGGSRTPPKRGERKQSCSSLASYKEPPTKTSLCTTVSDSTCAIAYKAKSRVHIPSFAALYFLRARLLSLPPIAVYTTVLYHRGNLKGQRSNNYRGHVSCWLYRDRERSEIWRQVSFAVRCSWELWWPYAAGRRSSVILLSRESRLARPSWRYSTGEYCPRERNLELYVLRSSPQLLLRLPASVWAVRSGTRRRAPSRDIGRRKLPSALHQQTPQQRSVLCEDGVDWTHIGGAGGSTEFGDPTATFYVHVGSGEQIHCNNSPVCDWRANWGATPVHRCLWGLSEWYVTYHSQHLLLTHLLPTWDYAYILWILTIEHFEVYCLRFKPAFL